MSELMLTADCRTSEEVHRLNQRRQYKLTLMGLDDLAEVLPPLADKNQQISKQMLLTEGIQYIHYLQLCIYQLGRDTNASDNQITQHLHWDLPCFLPCSCITKAEEKIKQGRSLTRERSTPSQVDGNRSQQKLSSGKKINPRTDTGNRRSCISSTPGKTTDRQSNPGRKPRGESGDSDERDGGSLWTISPIKLFGGVSSRKSRLSKDPELLSKSLPLPTKRKYGDIDDGIEQLSAGACEIITPPNSYKRTIIQDSPLDGVAPHNWDEVSVRKCSSPWMPKPENTQGNIEETAGKIPSHYVENNPDADGADIDVSDHFLSSSFAINSFLDSSCSEEEVHFPTFDGTSAQKTAKVTECTPAYSSGSSFTHARRGPDYKELGISGTTNLSTDYAEKNQSSPERCLGFSPGVFLTGRRFEQRKHS